MRITDISELVTNQVYALCDTQFATSKKVRCLGNYGVGDKVYFTDADSTETPETLATKFKANILPNSFVCWDYMLVSMYGVTTIDDWKVTDPSCSQMVNKLTDQIYQFKENRLINPETKEVELFESEIDLSNYTQDEMFNVDRLEIIKNQTDR